MVVAVQHTVTTRQKIKTFIDVSVKHIIQLLQQLETAHIKTMDKDDANEDKTRRTSESDGESTNRKPRVILQASDPPAHQQSQERGDRKRKPEPSAAASKKFKKPKDMPKRPLSAYNIYFQLERTKILEKHEQGEIQQDFHVIADGDETNGDGGEKKKKRQGGIFQALARTIADRWKAMPADERAKYENLASIEMQKYRKRMDQYKQDMVAQALADRRVRKLHPGDTDTSTDLPSSSEDGQVPAAAAVAPAVYTAGNNTSTGGSRTDSASSSAGTDTSISIQQLAAQELSNFLSQQQQQQQQATMQPNNSFPSNTSATSSTDKSAQQNAAQQLAAAFLSQLQPQQQQQQQTTLQFPFAIAGNISQPQLAPTTTPTDLQGFMQQLSGSHQETCTAQKQANIQELINAYSQQLLQQQSAPPPPQQPSHRPVQPQQQSNGQLCSSAPQNSSAGVDWSQATNLLTQQQQQQPQMMTQQVQQQPPDLISGFWQQLLGNHQSSGDQSVSTGQPSNTNNSFFSPDIFGTFGSNQTLTTTPVAAPVPGSSAVAPPPPLDQNMINLLSQALQPQQQQPPNFPGIMSGFVNPGIISNQQQQQQVNQSSPAPFTDANLMAALLMQQLLQQQQQQQQQGGGGNNHQP